jgi:hypothetical protein
MDWSARPALTIRAQTSLEELPETLGEAFSDIMSYLGELGESPTGAPFVAYYNFDLASMDIVIGFPVAHTLPGRGNIQASELWHNLICSTIIYLQKEQIIKKLKYLIFPIQKKFLL